MNTEGLCMICTGFGIADEDENGNVCGYTKTEYCLDNLKDLQRFLRRDDPQSRDVFKQICKWNTVSRDIIPIIEHYQSDRILVTNSVKILVFLTMPVDPDSAEVAQQIEYLWGLKAVLTRNVTIAVIVTLLEEPLGHLESGGFTEDDWKLVQLVLTLFRNILAIQSITIQQKASGSATELFYLTERFLELMFQENVMDLILVLARHIDDPDGYLRQDNFLLLEIFHHILLGKDPELIAKTFAVNHKTNTSSASSDPLRSLIEAEDEKRRAFKQRKFECRSKLSGTFTRFSMDGSKILLKNPASTFAFGLARAGKVHRGSLKKIACDSGSLAIQEENILELLHNFLNQFLAGGYNDFMQTIHDDIIKEQLDIQKSDIISFFQVTHFITAFHQKKILTKRQNMANMEQESSIDSLPADYLSLHQDLCGPIAATMNEAMYSLVMSKWREVSDGVKITNDYKFLTAAGSLLKSMVRMLDMVLKLQPEDSKECQTARVLLYKLFYDQTDEGLTQFLLNRFKCFDSHKQPKSDLADLLEIIHIMLRLMEKLQAHGTLRVSKKTRKRTVRNKASKDKIEAESELTKEPEIANEHAESVLTTYTDPAKSVNEKLSKLSSAEKDQAFNECSFDPTSPVEFSNPLLNKELCHDHLSVAQDDEENMKPADQEYEKGSSSNAEELATNEVNFNISALVSSFASNTVIHNLCWLLKHYTVNSASTNHYILCMLRRFCEDLELSPMLYQLSLLTIFYEILAEQKTCKSKEYTDIINFLTKFLRKMFKTMKKQPLLFVELLFWKTRRECQFINAEILVESIGNLRKGVRNLEDDQTGGFNHHRDMGYRSIADALGEDEIDLDLSQMHHNRRVEQLSNRATKSQVENGNIAYSSENETGNEGRENPSSLQANETSRWSNHLKFTQEQETAINELYEKYKTERQCSLLIAKALDPDGKISPAFISRKLKHLGLPLARKKKLVKANVPLSADRDRTIIGTASNATTQLDMNNAENNFPPKISRRKRIRAFSLEEESQITILYEKFKGHKKRNVMIANTLNPDKKFTAAEVSRKLIQLGLLPPRKRSSVLEKHKERDEFNDNTENSDEETLLAFSERSNRKKSISGTHAAAAASGSTQTKAMAQDNDSDDDMVLKSFFKGGSTKRKMKPEAAAQDDRAEAAATVSQTRHTELLEDMLDSGDEMGRLVEPQKLGSRKRMVLHIDEEDD